LKSKKRKTKNKQISFFLGSTEVHKCLLPEIPIKEDIIIEKSILFFSDPDPCMIHRSAVKSRILEETFSIINTETTELTDPTLISELKTWISLENFDKITLT